MKTRPFSAQNIFKIVNIDAHESLYEANKKKSYPLRYSIFVIYCQLDI